MNCLEARQQFAGFWRKSLDADERHAFLSHLAGCGACDHSFRVFALTAPVLYGELTRRAPQAATASTRHSAPSRRAGAGGRTGSRRLMGFALAAAVAAAVAVYFSLPPRVNFEDTIGEDSSGVARTNYSPPENLFWPVGSEPPSNQPDPDQPDTQRGNHKHLAS